MSTIHKSRKLQKRLGQRVAKEAQKQAKEENNRLKRSLLLLANTPASPNIANNSLAIKFSPYPQLPAPPPINIYNQVPQQQQILGAPTGFQQMPVQKPATPQKELQSQRFQRAIRL